MTNLSANLRMQRLQGLYPLHCLTQGVVQRLKKATTMTRDLIRVVLVSNFIHQCFSCSNFQSQLKYLTLLSHCQKSIQLSSCLAAKRMSSLSLCLVYNGKQCQTNCLYSLSGWFYNLSSPGFWSCRCISFCWRAPNLRRKQLKSLSWRPSTWHLL